MPAGLPETPWIRSYDTPALYLHGYGQGAQIAEAQARLAQQQQQFAVQSEMQKQEMEQKNRLAQQQMEIMNAYRTAQIGLQQQKLKEAQNVNAIKTANAAQLMQAQRKYQTDLNDIVSANPNLSYEEAQMKAISMNPGLWQHGGASQYSAMAREIGERRRADVAYQRDLQRDEFSYQRQQQSAMNALIRQKTDEINRELAPLAKNYADAQLAGNKEAIEALTKEIQEVKKRGHSEIQGIMQDFGYGGKGGAGGEKKILQVKRDEEGNAYVEGLEGFFEGGAGAPGARPQLEIPPDVMGQARTPQPGGSDWLDTALRTEEAAFALPGLLSSPGMKSYRLLRKANLPKFSFPKGTMLPMTP